MAMRSVVALASIVLAGFLCSAPARGDSTGQAVGQVATALGPAPSWVVSQGAAGTCVGEGIFLMAEVNVPAAVGPASERGVLSAPGVPNLGFTQDSSFIGVGAFGFVVFTAPYALPANTPLSLAVTTYRGPNYTGGPAYISEITWDCTTGEVLSSSGRVLGVAGAPALSPAAMTVLGGVLLAVAAVAFRRRSVA